MGSNVGPVGFEVGRGVGRKVKAIVGGKVGKAH